LFSTEEGNGGGGGKEQLSLKTSAYTCFRERSGVAKIENEHICSFSREKGDSGGKEQLPLKTSTCFRGRRVVVVKSNQSRKRTYMLVFKGEGRWWW
jgi:hypothetical protein